MTTNDDSNQSSECLQSKYQRQDDVHALHGGVLLQPQSSQHENTNSAAGSAHQVAHSTANTGHPSTFPGRNSPFVREGSMNSSLISNSVGVHGSDTFTNGTQVLSPSSFPPPDFKQEKNVSVSCEGSTHSSSVSGSLVNGLDQGSCQDSKLNLQAGEYLQQELKYFESVVKSFAVENTSSSQQPIEQTNVSGGPGIPDCDDGIRNTASDNQLRLGHQSQSLQLQKFARQSQLARAQHGGPFMDGQDHRNPQFQRQQSPQFPLGCVSQPRSGLRHQYTAGTFTSQVPPISTEQPQMFQDYNQAEVTIAGSFPGHLSYQRSLSSPASQHSLYRYSQDGLATAKLSHMPSQVQPRLYSHKFQSRPAIPVSQGPVSVRPISTLDVATRYAMTQSQLHYQRQTSVPTVQGQTFVDSESQFQQQVRGFHGNQTAFSGPSDPSASYHYQRRNSFPIYQRTNGQPHGNFPQGMLQGMGSSQANLLRGVLQASSTIPGERNAYLMNPNIGLPTSTAMQTGLQIAGRTSSVNGDLAPRVPRSQESAVLYRGNMSRHQSASVLQLERDFQGSTNTRKGVPEGSLPVFSGASVVLGDMSERQSTGTNSDHISGFSPLGVLDKAPSFTSLLEQSAISPGNLETTYTGSIPNLDLLGEILGQ